MVDFVQVAVKERKGGGYEAYPDFVVKRTEDLMVRGGKFYAVYVADAEGPGQGLWSTDEYQVQRIVDDKLHQYRAENKDVVGVKAMLSFGSNSQSTFRKYMREIGDNAHQLDTSLTFLTTKVDKKDYVSKRLPYDLIPGDISAWREILGTLYAETEAAKIEWFIGSIVSGDSKTNQKFLVLEGPPGAGKGTIINITLDLFPGYTTAFDAKALGSFNNQFASAAFENNPLLAIQHDGDLSRIEDNTLINQIVSHEVMKINQKHRPAYDAQILAALMMGTNKPVRITDSQSGIIRRLIDVRPTGNLIPPTRYHQLMDRIKFERGAIAEHCLQVYKKMGKGFYNAYRPLEMMYKTNAFFNYIEYHFDQFAAQGGVTSKQAFQLYKTYCEEANIDRPLKLHEFRAELSNYFEEFHDRITLPDGTPARSWYGKIKQQAFKMPVAEDTLTDFVLRLEETTSLLDTEYAECPAQYATASGAPKQKWDEVRTTLAELDTSKEHFVNGIPLNHLIADFDLTDENGEKSLELNLAAAAEWPPTYAELSRSGKAVHLHYKTDLDVTKLDPNFAPGIEIKVYPGNSALRRRLTFCNNVPIATLNSGLPFKEKKRVLDTQQIESERHLRALIEKNLRKEFHPSTKSSIDFIHALLEEAYESGLRYNVTDLQQRIANFATHSTNQPATAFRVVNSMKFQSADTDEPPKLEEPVDKREVIFDLEVYPNLFVCCWKYKSEPGEKIDPDTVVRMVNPTAQQIEAVMRMRLVGFNNRDYDNHIMWAAAMGYNNEQLYRLSKKIIDGVDGAKIPEAYRISYLDIYNLSNGKRKMGLKKHQIRLGLEHREMDIPWDNPVPDDRIEDVVEYCVNDVISLEHVMNDLSGDVNTRLILAELSGLTPNDTTNAHAAQIVFGNDKNPQREFVHTDLKKVFPGYEFDPHAKINKSTYKGRNVGEGGYVYAEPGLYRNVVLLDVASMHPTSIGQLNLFGTAYTARYMALVEAQLALKHKDYAGAKSMLDGKLVPYVEAIEKLEAVDPDAANRERLQLRDGLKIAMNIVYGMTSASYNNRFRPPNNAENVVAKRGALFMIDLQEFIENELELKVIHIKTDSVKVADATDQQIAAIQNFATKYGYNMEKEAVYAKLGIVNDAVYVAQKDGEWDATGKQFQVPYVFKSLFGLHDEISFLDYREQWTVKEGHLALDFGYDGDGFINSAVQLLKAEEKNLRAMEKKGTPDQIAEATTNVIEALKGYDEALAQTIFVGKTGMFVPVKPGYGGGQLLRIKDGKHYYAADSKGFMWMDAELASKLPDEAIDVSFFEEKVEAARASLDRFLVGSSFADLAEFLA